MEYYLKDDALGDPMVTEEHIAAIGWVSSPEFDDIIALTLRVNDFLSGILFGVGIRLVDFKLEFGRVYEDDYKRVILVDEISPDTCRLWDSDTNEKLDKDVFREDLGDLSKAYSEVASRLGVMPRGPSGGGQPSVVTNLFGPDGSRPGASRKGAADMRARVRVMLRDDVLDPQGEAIRQALKRLGFEGVASVRQGKIVEIDLAETDPQKVKAAVREMCDRLLATPSWRLLRGTAVMRAAVVVFPGSNCDRDMAVAFKGAGAEVRMVWHKEDGLPDGMDVVGLPGGFSFGDYLRSGAIAANSPVFRSVAAHAERGGYVLGVCNGFQMLTETGLLPGTLLRNRGNQVPVRPGEPHRRDGAERVHGGIQEGCADRDSHRVRRRKLLRRFADNRPAAGRGPNRLQIHGQSQRLDRRHRRRAFAEPPGPGDDAASGAGGGVGAWMRRRADPVQVAA